MRRDWWIYAALVLAIVAAYAQVSSFQFVNYDDPDYVTENLHVREGLTASSVTWAFTATEYANWFPLTWLSHMLDVELYGLRAGGHHVTNVAIHIITTLLLFGLLKKITGDRWPSAFVAFAFGLHPLHVESVAWIAERKDVLSGLFYILSLWAYVRWVAKRSWTRYALILIAFACGIMSKPMIVTMPFAALLLDYWPLHRLSRKSVMEKIPLFALSIAASVIAYVVQQNGGAVNTLAEIPFTLRFENAAVSYLTYVFQFVWPTHLAVFYPFPPSIPAWEWIAAILALIGITILALHRAPIAVGWLWFLGTLVPVIGLVKIGIQSHADRYTYIPLIGLSIVVAWGVEAFVKQARWLTIPAALLFAAYVQAGTWHDSTTLFEHALAVTNGNFIAHNNLGVALRRAGHRPDALAHFEEAVKLWPQYPEAQTNIGEALLTAGRRDDALPHILEALKLDPKLPEAHINLGAVRNQQNRPDLAEAEYRTALELKPSSAEAHDGLGVVFAETNRNQEALAHYNEAISLDPNDADSHYNLGRLYGLTGHPDQAIVEFRQALRIDPANAETHFNLGTAYAQKDQMNEAVAEFTAAVRSKPDYAGAHFNLGSALARLDRYDEAIAEFTAALRLDPNLPGAREAIEYCKSLQANKQR